MAAELSDLERASIERACERVLVRFCHLIDLGHATQVADLFTPDGVWNIPWRTVVGREEIRKAFAERESRLDRRSMHVITNVLVTAESATRASSVAYYRLYRRDGVPADEPAPFDGPIAAGHYRDRFLLTDEGWRIAERETSIAFYRPE